VATPSDPENAALRKRSEGAYLHFINFVVVDAPWVLATRAYSGRVLTEEDTVIRGRLRAVSGEHLQSMFLHDGQQFERHAAGFLGTRFPLLHR
jgi:hypothetical protein